MADPQHNWAGNYTYGAARLHSPSSITEVQALVARSRALRVLGTRHSFNNIADSAEDLISLRQLDRVVALDRSTSTVTIEAGISYGQLCQQLENAGFALHNLASLPHISVAGACATATHGSGDRNGNLATAVAALELVTASGDLVELTRAQHGETLLGAVVGLGGLGVVTKLTLDLLPSFTMRQDVYEDLPLAVLEQHFDEVMSSGYSVSLFTDWRGLRFNQVWLKRRVDAGDQPPASLFGASRATEARHPITGLSAVNCTAQLGQPGPWYERLPHFRMDYQPSSGAELQSEYFVPRQHAYAALCALAQLRAQVAPLLLIAEVRSIAADTLWMSPCYQQDCVGLHFTWRQDWPAVQLLLPQIEAALAPFAARPHWGKLFTMAPAVLQAHYPRLPDFRALLQHYDPGGTFRNAFLTTFVTG